MVTATGTALATTNDDNILGEPLGQYYLIGRQIDGKIRQIGLG
jgi:hypothetical protein